MLLALRQVRDEDVTGFQFRFIYSNLVSLATFVGVMGGFIGFLRVGARRKMPMDGLIRGLVISLIFSLARYTSQDVVSGIVSSIFYAIMTEFVIGSSLQNSNYDCNCYRTKMVCDCASIFRGAICFRNSCTN